MRKYSERSLPARFAVVLLPSLAVLSCLNWANAETSNGKRHKNRPVGKATYQVELTDPVAPQTPPRTYDVVQTRDRRGFPAKYAMSFVTHVCTDDQCKPVDVTMVWDAVGFFERLDCPPDKPLTKKDHVLFDDRDYAKLDRILKDGNSVLASWQISFLEKPEGMRGELDAVTAPTPTTVQNSVIEDAAFTTWALWHWANGEIVPKLRAITSESCTPEYLNFLLRSDERRYADFALQYVTTHHASDPQFVDGVFQVLTNGQRDQIKPALEFLSGAVPNHDELYARLIDACCEVRSADCPLILEKLDADPNLPAATLEGLTARLGELPYFPIHLILRMLEKRDFSSEKTLADVAALLKNDDFFIARRAYEHLLQQKLDADTEKQVAAFQAFNKSRL